MLFGSVFGHIGSSDSNPALPKGMDQKFYQNALSAFKDINKDMYTLEANQPMKPDNSESIKWVADQHDNLAKNPSSYTEQETEVINGLYEMLAAVSDELVDGPSGNNSLSATDQENLRYNYNSFQSAVAKLLGVDESEK